LSFIQLIRKTPFPATAAADALVSAIRLGSTILAARQEVRSHAHAAACAVRETDLMCAYLLAFGDEMTDESLNRAAGHFLDFTEKHLR